jgi:nitrate/TMAO reductase-like tetraheme cytochrome c subunit
MTDERSSSDRRFRDTAGALSPAVLALVGAIILLAVGGGGYYAYQTYDYVQHDNNFCVSCHLMEEPFELFAESAHQGLGCKACHRPNMFERSAMGLTQVVDSPEEISVHAAVPNEICAECHIEGDPEKWRLIANSVGHQVHLESEDPDLQGLQCVECHSSSLHEFAPIDRTCAQSGCHEDKSVQLGEMSDLTIHCAACHNFVAPVQEAGLLGNALDAAILPNYEDCLSCHVMRTLAQMPEPDPHQGTCAACHNPHEQSDPSEAADSCATAGCHDDPLDLTPFHRGLDADADCLECHQAHDFALDAADCAGCHEAEGREPAPRVGGALDFAHDEHTVVECASCHVSDESHGAATVTAVADCQSCHHTVPVSRDCARCHEAADAPVSTHRWTQEIHLDVGVDESSRTFVFPHASHNDSDCASCHSEGLELEPSPELDCQSCHEDHHTPVSDCAACHKVAPVSAHPPEEAHVTCSGAGCHETVPFEGVPRTRPFCLGCHQDLTDHEPDRPCAECHTLPEPRQTPGSVP